MARTSASRRLDTSFDGFSLLIYRRYLLNSSEPGIIICLLINFVIPDDLVVMSFRKFSFEQSSNKTRTPYLVKKN